MEGLGTLFLDIVFEQFTFDLITEVVHDRKNDPHKRQKTPH
jgi:hypothetical protein